MATVIVPAHNEANVIGRCLDSIIHQPGVNKIIVACNGCSDGTYDTVVNRYGKYDNLICLDLAKPSKTNAINEAESYIESYPVFYIDADTRLSEGAIAIVADAMPKLKLELAAPTPVVDTSNSSWLVRQYYNVWLKLPYVKDGVIATCSFVVSEQGRKRFGQFPDVISDDGYIRCQFERAEIGNIPGAEIRIMAPRDVVSLIKIKTRARLGNMQLNRLKLCTYPTNKAHGRVMISMIFSRNALPAIVYYSIASLIRIRSLFQMRRIDHYRWEKDMTTR
jgi:glycosyltransferase involved in cell wall biosynthesis